MTATTATAAPADPGKTAAEAKAAVWVGILCYSLWGLLPLFLVQVARQHVDPWEATAQRCLWAMLFAGGFVALTGGFGEALGMLKKPKALAMLGTAAAALALNWVLFTWASIQHHVQDASLAYFINPLLNMVVGWALFKERLSKLGWAAVGLAAIGVAVQTYELGRLPMVSLGIALTFLAYGIIRKKVAISAVTGQFIECLLLAPFGLAYVLWLNAQGLNHFGSGWGPSIWIMLLGPATVIPFSMFAWAARRMPFSTLGFLQFIAPTLLFVVALTTGEKLSTLRMISFAFIWAGVALFAFRAWKTMQDKRRLAAA